MRNNSILLSLMLPNSDNKMIKPNTYIIEKLYASSSITPFMIISITILELNIIYSRYIPHKIQDIYQNVVT